MRKLRKKGRKEQGCRIWVLDIDWEIIERQTDRMRERKREPESLRKRERKTEKECRIWVLDID